MPTTSGAVMQEREGLDLEREIQNGRTDLFRPAQKLIEADIDPLCLRDLTRGGPASTLIKLARSTEQDFEINETLCLNADVHAFARPSVLARFTSLTKALFVPETQTEKALTVLRRHPFGQQARHVSQVKCAHAQGLLALKTIRNTSRAPAY